jgi:hypothetical protein
MLVLRATVSGITVFGTVGVADIRRPNPSG